MNTEIFDLGKIGITLGGEYDNKVIYEKLTIVLYKGKSYISTKTTQGISPEEDILVWQLVAEAKDAYHMLIDAGKTTLSEVEFLEQLVDATKERYIVQGNVINIADEEDLTNVNVGGTDVLKLKDKVYNPLTYNGLGKKILRKNIVNGINTLTQSMINQPNTIYVIKYDFTLVEDITIPTNCVLEFDGGSISGANTLTGANTRINAGLIKIFNTDVTIAGSWNVANVYPEWFGAVGDGITDDYNALNTVFTLGSRFKIPVRLGNAKTYLVNSKSSSSNILFNSTWCTIQGNKSTIKIGIIGTYEAVFNTRGQHGHCDVSNFTIELNENNTVTSDTGIEGKGDRRIDFITGGITGYEGYTKIENITIKNAVGVWQFVLNQSTGVVKNNIIYYGHHHRTYDATSIYLWGHNIICEGNMLYGADETANTGIEFHGYDITVKNNTIIDYNAPVLIVNDNTRMEDVEIRNLILSHNYFNCKNGIVIWMEFDAYVENIHIDNNTVISTGGNTNDSCIWLYDKIGACHVKNIYIKDNLFKQTPDCTKACVYIAPSRFRDGSIPTGGNFKIDEWIFENNKFECSNTFANLSAWISIIPNSVDKIKFLNNIIYLNTARVLQVVNNKNLIKQVIFDKNIIYGNSNLFATCSNPNDFLLIFGNNIIENEITSVVNFQTGTVDDNKHSVHLIGTDVLNMDFNKNIPIADIIYAADKNNIKYSDVVRFFAINQAEGTIGGKTVVLHKGWNYFNAKNGFLEFSVAEGQKITKVDFFNCNYPLSVLNYCLYNTGVSEFNSNGINTRNVKKLNYAFQNTKIKSIDLSSFDINSVTHGDAIFSKNSQLEYLDVSSFDFSTFIYANSLFNNCPKLKTLRLGSFDLVSKVNRPSVTANNIFVNDTSLKHIYTEAITTESINDLENRLYSDLQNIFVEKTIEELGNGIKNCHFTVYDVIKEIKDVNVIVSNDEQVLIDSLDLNGAESFKFCIPENSAVFNDQTHASLNLTYYYDDGGIEKVKYGNLFLSNGVYQTFISDGVKIKRIHVGINANKINSAGKLSLVIYKYKLN